MYGANKVADEQLLTCFHKEYGLAFIGLRYLNVYGPRQPFDSAYMDVIMHFLNRLDGDESPIIHGDGTQTVDLVFVEDVATAFGQDQRYKDSCEVILDLDDVPPDFLDGSRVRQVVWNLLLNAAQATPDYGRIEVSVALDEDAVIIRISDEGVGISREGLGRIFDPFYTTRTGGTGLGLANVERIVRAHGGVVSVSSTVGVGTLFSLSFPTAEVSGGVGEESHG